jgi:cytochrome P450
MASALVRYIPFLTSQVRGADFAPRFFSVSLTRLAMRSFTFSNGVTVPAGTLVSIPASAAHRDERIFPNPDKFDGFRFAKLRESEGDTTSRYQAVSASNEHLPFGLGRHAW